MHFVCVKRSTIILKDFSKQNMYIRSYVMYHEVKRKRIEDGSGSIKNVSYSYVFRWCARNLSD